MKILYAIQGTGNGHISRALEIVPILQKKGNVDVLVSASQWELQTSFDIKYKLHGFGFIFGKKGGVDILRTYLNMDTSRLFSEIRELPVQKYDLVISDFEPVSAWACQLRKVPCIGLSNQAVTLHPLAPKPESTDRIGKLILEKYAPATANYGFHFRRFDENVYTPIIGKDVRETEIEKKDHIAVYLPSFDDERVINKLWQYKDISFRIFSKKTKTAYRERNFWVLPADRRSFIRTVATSSGVITNAGFGTSAEALFLGKPLMVIPMKTQYEQHCNAAVLQTMNVSVLPAFKRKHLYQLDEWLNKPVKVKVDYPDETELLLDKIITRHAGKRNNDFEYDTKLKYLHRLLRPTVPAV